MKKQIIAAYGLHIMRSLIYGSTFLFADRLLQSTSVSDVLALRFLLCAVLFGVLTAFGVIRISYKGKKLRWLLACALFEPILYFILETYGLRGISTSLAGILAAVNPIMIAVLETVFLGEKTSPLQKLLLGVGIAGVLLATVPNTAPGGVNTVWGILLMLGAQLAGCLFCISSRKTSEEFSAMEITFATTMVGALVFNGISLAEHWAAGTVSRYFAPLLRPDNLLCFLFLSVVSSFAATVMNNYALSKIQASALASMGGIATITAIVLGFAVNHEIIHWYQLVGALLILIGAGGVNYISLKKSRKTGEEF